MIEKTGFVIVNYCTSDDVQLCIESIFQYLDNENFIIIVVDNNSPDKSGKKLQEKYDNEKNCEVILNNSNLGYARGNNIGIKLCINKYNCDFVCILNPDIRIMDNMFASDIRGEYREHMYDVLSGIILDQDGNAANISYNNDDLIAIPKLKYRRMKCQVYRFFLPFFYLFSEIRNKRRQKRKNEVITDNRYNVQLPGCFLVFSPDFLKNQGELFPGTFMFMEEEILYYQVMKRKAQTMFSTKIRVKHIGGVSRGSGLKRCNFTLKETVKSMDKIIEFLALEKSNDYLS